MDSDESAAKRELLEAARAARDAAGRPDAGAREAGALREQIRALEDDKSAALTRERDLRSRLERAQDHLSAEVSNSGEARRREVSAEELAQRLEAANSNLRGRVASLEAALRAEEQRVAEASRLDVGRERELRLGSVRELAESRDAERRSREAAAALERRLAALAEAPAPPPRAAAPADGAAARHAAELRALQNSVDALASSKTALLARTAALKAEADDARREARRLEATVQQLRDRARLHPQTRGNALPTHAGDLLEQNALDAVDSGLVSIVKLLRSTAAARLVFFGYFAILHIWVLAVLHTHSQLLEEPPPIDFVVLQPPPE
ncbi:hypothetical protein M885DRAFT_610303 [Pelagophyceae sp. CCMP2097]|nr:hypothetical protein M885DRAFT_610303 [Pelagophyceae sp. CCMP2097]